LTVTRRRFVQGIAVAGLAALVEVLAEFIAHSRATTWDTRASHGPIYSLPPQIRRLRRLKEARRPEETNDQETVG